MIWTRRQGRAGLSVMIAVLLISNLACSSAEDVEPAAVVPPATPLPTFTPVPPPTAEPAPPEAAAPPTAEPGYEVIEAAAEMPPATPESAPPAVPAQPELPPITDFETVSLVRFVDSDNVEVLVDGVPYVLPYVWLPPVPTPIPTAPPSASWQWDRRLDDLGVTVNRTQPAPGQTYFRLVSALFRDEVEAGGLHHIYVEVLDEDGRRILEQPIIQAWQDGQVTFYPERKNAPEYGANVPIYGVLGDDNYRIYVDGAPSDVIKGLGLPGGRHVSYLLTFQRMQN